MNQAEEDALVASLIDKHPGMAVVSPRLVRLAIRAAYAKGREDAAKVCEDEKFIGTLSGSQQDHNDTCDDCAAAIRRGE